MGISSADELRCGDEVEFLVGPRDLTRPPRGDQQMQMQMQMQQDGLSAYQVRVVEKGSVEWEVEEEPKGQRRVGRVERMIRWGGREGGGYSNSGGGGGGGDSSAMVGTIRVVGFKDEIQQGNDVKVEQSRDQNDAENNVVEIEKKSSLAEESEELLKNKNQSRDMIKGTLARFTPDDYDGYRSKSRTNALERNDLVEFTLVTEKRSGIKYARNITLIQSERERLEEERERKMLENATLESGIVVSLKKGYGFLKSNQRREEIYFHFSHVHFPEQDRDGCASALTLEEGQDMEFLVVKEGSKLAARNLKFLPRGSVEFEQVIAKGVTGVLKLVPRFSNLTNSARRSGKNLQDEQYGKIRLDHPIQFVPKNTNNGQEMVVSEVNIRPDDCKCLFKDEKTAELWVRVGDSLRFDVIRDSVDGLCRVAPTTCNADGSQEDGGNPKIRLVSLGLAGRAEGIVASIKNDYGFIELAHRNVDVYFRLSELMPPSLQQDLVPICAEQNQHALSVGSEVTFDLSLLPPRNRSGKSDGRSFKRSGEKDQLRAQRLIILPPGTVSLTKEESDVIGFVTRMKGGYSGQIRLNKKMKAMTQKQNYPLIMKLIEDFSLDSSEGDLHFLDVQSEFENDIIADIVERRSGMSMNFLPVSDFGDSNRGRISIKKIENSKQNFVVEEGVSGQNVTDENNDKVIQDENEVNPINETDSDAEVENNNDEGIEQDAECETNKNEVDLTSKKRVRKRIKSVQVVTFDRQSLSPSFVDDPPMAGDKVSMTVTYCRRTDQFSVSNMVLVERNEPVGKAVKYNLCEGYVLLEPAHTSIKDNINSKGKRRGFEGGGGWGSDETTKDQTTNSNEDGIILLLDDPAGLFHSRPNDCPDDASKPKDSLVESDANVVDERPNDVQDGTPPVPQHIRYTLSSVGNRNTTGDTPKRGDLVTFTKGKNGMAKDISVVTKSAAKIVNGCLSKLQMEDNLAIFTCTTTNNDNQMYNVNLSQVISCDARVLKEETPVEGILHEDKIVGICRTDDLYLKKSATVGSGLRERPKLNLTVKKELQKNLGGKIIAQSCMAKGPDGTMGFHSGWTDRISRFISILPTSPIPDLKDDVMEEEQVS